MTYMPTSVPAATAVTVACRCTSPAVNTASPANAIASGQTLTRPIASVVPEMPPPTTVPVIQVSVQITPRIEVTTRPVTMKEASTSRRRDTGSESSVSR
jgi:hypothetical protein